MDKNEADFYHLPAYVPYLKKYQKNLKEFGFDWDLAVHAMQCLIEEMDAEEYKPYKLFIRKWSFYKELSKQIKEENWLEAEKIIDKILSIDLLDPSAYLNLGFIFRRMEKYEKAEQAYKKGQELMPESAPFMAGLARTYDECGKREQAIDAWQALISKIDNESELAEAYQMLEQYNVFRKVEKEDPRTKAKKIDYVPAAKYDDMMHKEFLACGDDIDALTKLGLKLTKSGQTKVAMKVFAKVYELSKSLEKTKA